MKQLRTLFLRFQPTQNLLTQLRVGSNATALALLDIIKERAAHQDGTLRQIDLRGAQLTGATFATAELTGSDFSGAELINCYFYDSKLQSTSFVKANLSGANFRSAALQGADFDHSLLSAANFSRADLSGVRLTHANLSGANFWQTVLRGANFSGADLLHATMIDVVCDASTILPDGTSWTPQTDWSAFTRRAE
jgi:uncharacterized protein YjbI with pentapeptide repeats